MAFVDHDLHIHSYLSPCAGEKGKAQTTQRILDYARECGLKMICVTDHFWDETVKGAEGTWYEIQNLAHIRNALPLPQTEDIRFLFGCETDMDRHNVIGLAPEHYGLFDFVIIPTNHLHLKKFTCRGDEDAIERKSLWLKRLDYVLEQDLPFEKIGIAHLTDTGIMDGRGYLDVLQMISDEEYRRAFRKAARRGVGIELNFRWLRVDDEEMKIHLRPYSIAKEEGCRFYLGSDAHAPEAFYNMKENFEKITEALKLTESDKFVPFGV